MAALRFHIGCCLILWWSPILVPAAEVAKARTDAYGDPLPNGALARLGTVRFRLPHWSYSLALSPDGKLLAATAGNDTIGLIDTATGLQVRQIKIGITGGRGGLFFSPDSTRLATIGFQGIEVHDINTGNEFATSAVQYRGGSASLAFSADGKLLAVGGDGLGTKSPIKVWNLETKKEVASLDVLHNINVQVALSADGKVLANWGQSSPGEGRHPGFLDSPVVGRGQGQGIAPDRSRELPGRECGLFAERQAPGSAGSQLLPGYLGRGQWDPAAPPGNAARFRRGAALFPRW